MIEFFNMKDELLMSCYILSENIQTKLQNPYLSAEERKNLMEARFFVEELMQKRLHLVEMSEKIEQGLHRRRNINIKAIYPN
jgi:hypothetical protein